MERAMVYVTILNDDYVCPADCFYENNNMHCKKAFVFGGANCLYCANHPTNTPPNCNNLATEYADPSNKVNIATVPMTGVLIQAHPNREPDANVVVTKTEGGILAAQLPFLVDEENEVADGIGKISLLIFVLVAAAACAGLTTLGCLRRWRRNKEVEEEIMRDVGSIWENDFLGGGFESQTPSGK